jgi:GNAT acetyltransferase-like protein
MALGNARRSSSRVELLGPSDPAWDDHLSVAKRDIYHLAGYHAYAEGSGDGEPMLIIVGDRGQGLAWPYLLRRVDAVQGLAGTDATDITSVYGYPGPIAWGCKPGDSFIAQAWQEILEVWRQQHVVSAFTRFHPLLGNAATVANLPPPVDRAGMPLPQPLVPGGPTVSIDCRLDDGAARRGYAKVLRQEIDAARRAGLVTEVDEDWSEIETFTRLYGETMQRSGAGAEYMLGPSDVRRLREALGGRLHLLVTRWEDAVGAACLLTELDGIVQAHLAGTNDDLRHLSPLKVLLDDARSWARSRGDHVLHLGGGRAGKEDSLFAFKARFSPSRHAFHTGRWILEPRLYREFVAARRCPPGTCDSTGEGYFPAYRARPASVLADPEDGP